MINRLQKLTKDNSYFLFGPRQTGKSTLLRESYAKEEVLYYDLLQSTEYLKLSAAPSILRQEILAVIDKMKVIIIDEIQRIPLLLDEVHSLIEDFPQLIFCLSGSSARKLKRKEANLLAGRAWQLKLHPLTHLELGKKFDLNSALAFGTLPKIVLSDSLIASKRTLRAYVETYLREEVEQEANVRNLGGFIRFMDLAAEFNGNIINYSTIARECGVSYQTIKEYFKILEDTLMGFFLMPYAKSTRKRLIKHPKFYFFDTGVQRAIAKKLNAPLKEMTYDYGMAFEQFIILEIIRLNDYFEKDYQFSFYRSSNQAEVDLIVETPQQEVFAIEIKSSKQPEYSAIKGLESFKEICPKAKLCCVSNIERKRVAKGIEIFPWEKIFEEIGLK